jgi:hypothetical protein
MEDDILCIFVCADRLFDCVYYKARKEGTLGGICYDSTSVCIHEYQPISNNKVAQPLQMYTT